MAESSAVEIIKKYFNAFNQGQTKEMISLLHPEVEHDINQGQTQVGIDAFIKFMSHMDECYKEQLKNITYFVSENHQRVSAEFDVHGTYLKTDGSLPPARGQQYVIPAGSFFEIKNNQIKRVTTYYNLPKWIEMVK